MDTAVEVGDIRERIIDSAEEWSADLIVVGSHGRSGIHVSCLAAWRNSSLAMPSAPQKSFALQCAADVQGGCSTFALWDDFHGHVAQLGKNPTQLQQRPPIVKIDLHRSPHGDPSGNRKALPYDGSPSTRLVT